MLSETEKQMTILRSSALSMTQLLLAAAFIAGCSASPVEEGAQGVTTQASQAPPAKIIALSGGSGWTEIPVATSNDDGSFTVTSNLVANFPSYAQQQGATLLPGDFNNDGKPDLALTGGFTSPGVPWGSVPVALGTGPGTFSQTNAPILNNFATYATQSGAKAITGDFNGDHRTDIALTGGFSSPGVPWGSVPVALANADGTTFTVTNAPILDFATYATQSGAKAVTGDFNGDGRDDIALTGGFSSPGVPWGSVPVALANPGGTTFTVSNLPVPNNFGTYATQSGAKPVSGDFNGDGRGDIALTGGFQSPGVPWGSVPVAFANAGGTTFSVQNDPVPDSFGTFATQGGAKPVAGDFNHDGRSDIALTGGSSSPGVPWGSLPVAFSNGNGTFTVKNKPILNFGTWSALPNVQAVGTL